MECPVCSLPCPDGVQGQEGSSLFYHQECLICTACKEKLDDTYVSDMTGGTLFCNTCFRENNPCCAKCDDPLFGCSLTVEGMDYHSSCFTCSNCSAELGINAYFGNSYHDWRCAECHAKYGQSCAYCSEVVTGVAVSVCNRLYHLGCARCATCKTTIKETTAYLHPKTGALQCKDCHMPEPPPEEDDDTTPKCAGCGKEMGEKFVVTKTHKFHPNCFVCNVCWKPIKSTFSVQSDGKVTCGHCYEKEVPKCTQCKGGIYGLYKIVEGKGYHNECFRCCEPDCGVCLGVKYYKSKKGFKCETCNLKQCEVCAICDEEISSGMVKVVAEFRTHPECLKCATCGEVVEEELMLLRDPLKVACRLCYSKRAPHCAKCSVAIIGTFMTVEDSVYHQECFCCASCSKPIAATEKFVKQNGGFVCQTCV